MTSAMTGTITPPRIDVPDEVEALVRLVIAADGTACAVHDVGPVANHLAGPTAALRPDWHPRYADVLPGQRNRTSEVVDGLITRAAGLIRCTCPPSWRAGDLLFVVPRVSEGAVARPAPQHRDADVEAAIQSGDVDAALPILDGRVDALKMLSDRARAAGGGTLDSDTGDAIRSLAVTLLGRTRWDVIGGWERGFEWPTSWRFGSGAVRAHVFLTIPDIGDRITRRLVEGR